MLKYRYTLRILLFCTILLCGITYTAKGQGSGHTTMCKLKQSANGKWLMGVPDSLLNRDLLFGARVISLTNADKAIAAGQMRYNPVVVQLVAKDNNILFTTTNVSDIAEDGSPLKEAVRRNTRDAVALLLPIVEFDDNLKWVNLSAVFDKPFPLVFPIATKNQTPVIENLSELYDAKAYLRNLEMKAVYQYDSPEEPFSAEIQYSLVLLSDKPMRQRYNDERVGYKTIKKRIYGDKKPVESAQYICRWRVEPRPEDVEAHKRGEIVECQKPIVVYVDSGVPKDWRSYVRQGIEDWNQAFEAIGFKNVIQTRELTPDIDSEDSRNICFRYIPLDLANANGALWNDPRTGEIVQADILFWQNVTDLLQTWRFVQTAAVDPKARPAELDNETMGEIIRYAVAHEMGHVLGLQHNMRSSYAYPVDSLRSPSFTQKYGTTASIMDYARFNYIAQPGDPEKGVKLIPPVLGPFDFLSIEYGYRIFYDTKNEKEEKPHLNKIFEEVGDDPMYLFSPLTIGTIPADPASQNDALGNDLRYGAELGIKNIQVITDNLADWTVVPDGNPLRMIKMYDAVRKHYFRLLSLSLSNIGGVHSYPMVEGKMQKPLEYIPKEKQAETLRFILGELQRTGTVLETEQIKNYLGSQSKTIMTEQTELLDRLFSSTIFTRLIEQEASNINGYKLSEFFSDSSAKIFMPSGKKLSIYEQAIQLYYVNRLKQLTEELSTKEKHSPEEMLISSYAQSELLDLKNKISSKKDAHSKTLLSIINSCGSKSACTVQNKVK